MGVEEHTIELAASPAFFRRAPAEDPTPVLLHDVPTSSDDLLAVLERTGGIAPDLPGFGRSGKGGHLDFTLAGHAAWVLALLDALEIGRIRLIGHGWGAAVAVELAATAPDRVQRLTLVAPGRREGRLERALRTPVVGELAMGSITRRMLAGYLRRGTVRPDALSDEHIAAIWEQFDQGTQRATLRLVRATSPGHPARPNAPATAPGHPTTPDAPATVLCGARDPWFDPAVAHALGEVKTVQDAGHWPWLDRPDAVALVAA